MTDEVSPLRLRERKKRRSREAILTAAMTLFRQRGYDHVTVEEVAAAADISTRTFYHYFSAKEDLVLQFHARDLRRLVDNVRAAPADASALAILAEEMCRGIGSQDQALIATRFEIMNRTPILQSKLRARRAMWASEIADVLVERGHFGGDLSAALLLGRCTVAATETAVEAWVRNPSETGVSGRLRELLEMLAVGFEATDVSARHRVEATTGGKLQ